MEIVKAEILWSRKCTLHCGYCAMTKKQDNSPPLKDWKRAFDNLKELGCKFAAFYGAEPFLEPKKLPRLIQYVEKLGIDTTIITSGLAPDTHKMIDKLKRAGLKSLTVSFDFDTDDRSVLKKSEAGLGALAYFDRNHDARDLAVVSTLTRLNYRSIVITAKTMSELGIWTLFDFIHPNRGQPGAKCKSMPGIENLLFREEDIPSVLQHLKILLRMKRDGALIHMSDHFMKTLEKDNTILTEYSWNCAVPRAFPSWVTIDSDGIVYPCDDFKPSDGPKIYMTDLAEDWEYFGDVWQNIVIDKCPGCCWNTHIDAHAIKAGRLPISNYVHRD
jgi:MoaA/NifB/PqqE/SkfB family radical SAM enzyme